jgi:hypothetical protein
MTLIGAPRRPISHSDADQQFVYGETGRFRHSLTPSVEAGGLSSLFGFDGTEGASDCSAAALTFLGRPLCRSGLTASVDGVGGWGGVGSDRADASSSLVKAFGTAPCTAILAAKASSTRLASSVDRRFLAMPRGRRGRALSLG